MAKNDYRRSLIMLRGMEKGYSGHARLETRVLSGSLNVTVSTPAGDIDLCVALIGWRGKNLTGVNLGRLRDDGRGQKGLLATFDPRNVAGIGLDAAIAIVVVRGGEPVLYGWINGSTSLDWQEVRDFLLTICGQPVTPPAPETPEEDSTPDEAPTPEDGSTSDEAPTPEDGSTSDEAPTPEDGSTSDETTTPEDGSTSDEAPTPGDSSAPAEGEEAANGAFVPASQALALDMDSPWPSEVEDLRVLFLTRPRFEPFDMPGFVFVQAAMAEETHIDYCGVGIRAEDGRVTGVCYAIPMPYSPNPPAGLEEAVWIGDSNRGWWVTVRDVSEE